MIQKCQVLLWGRAGAEGEDPPGVRRFEGLRHRLEMVSPLPTLLPAHSN